MVEVVVVEEEVAEEEVEMVYLGKQLRLNKEDIKDMLVSLLQLQQILHK